MAGTIFERCGGFATASRVVMDLYDRILDSDIIGDYFTDVDMPRLIDHQTKLVASIMGGPASYSDESLRQVHSHLAIDRVAFDEMARLFRETLESMGFAQDDVEALVAAVEARAPFVITAE